MTPIGLATVLYQSNDVLEDFFKSLNIQTFKNYHLYIIDNSPSTETDELLAQLLAKYPVTAYTHVQNPENYGVAKGNNQGIKLALENDAEYVLLLNNDINIEQTTLLEDMVNCAIQKNENIIVPKIYYYGTNKIWHTLGEFVHYKGTTRGFGEKEEDNGQFDEAGYTGYAPTCFMLISKKVFEAVGIMDEKYFVYYDDDDFVLRAIRNGFKIYYFPEAEVFHKISFSTGGAESLFSIYYLNRNRIYFIRKHYTFPMKQIALSHTLITKGIRYFMYNADRKKKLAQGLKDGFAMKVQE